MVMKHQINDQEKIWMKLFGMKNGDEIIKNVEE
jgi:hypothetical protein